MAPMTSQGFPPIVLAFIFNSKRQSAAMTYYVHDKEENYKGLRFHCTDRRCSSESDAWKGFEQLYNSLQMRDPRVLILVEEKFGDKVPMRIAQIAEDVYPLPLKAFDLQDVKLLAEFVKPPRIWTIDQGLGGDEGKVTPNSMALIRFGNERPEVVRSALALVKYLQTRYDEVVTFNEWKMWDEIVLPRIDFQFFSLDKVVSIDRNTLYALNIFRADDHPWQQRKRSKDFCIYSFLECFIVSQGGRKCLLEWCTQPTRDLGELRMRQDSIQLVQRLRPLVEEARKQITSWKSSAPLWAKLRRNIRFDNMGDWKKFIKEQEKLVETLRFFQELDEKNLPCVKGIKEAVPPIQKSLLFLHKMLDFSQLDELDDPCVRLHSEIDAFLAANRKKYNNISHYLDKLGTLQQEYAFESKGHFLPSYGFCVSVGEEDETPIDYELKFSLNGRLFFKTKYCKLMDAELGGLYVEIRRREIKLLASMIAHLRPIYDYWLETIARLVNQFDVLTGLAYCAAQYEWTRPIFVEKPLAHLVKGMHPLVEHALDTERGRNQRSFVPNDTNLGGSCPPIQVITGANSSGKSVYLKQVGILHFLAHIGSYVPAKSCMIGLTDIIFSRIRTLESASVQLSAFEIDVSQMSRILQSATENSLILVDEFGKGTRPDDGASLLASCILHLADRKPVPPRTILTTHYPEIFTLRLVTHSAVQCFFMGTERGKKNISGTRSLEYQYRLRPGVCVRSYGIECAELAGIPSEILCRAVEIYNHLVNGDGIPTFEVKAMRLLQAFDWKRGDKATLVARLRDILSGKDEYRPGESTPYEPPVTEEMFLKRQRADPKFQTQRTETPPLLRNGLDPRGSDVHCSAEDYIRREIGPDDRQLFSARPASSYHKVHDQGVSRENWQNHSKIRQQTREVRIPMDHLRSQNSFEEVTPIHRSRGLELTAENINRFTGSSFAPPSIPGFSERNHEILDDRNRLTAQNIDRALGHQGRFQRFSTELHERSVRNDNFQSSKRRCM